MSVQSDTKLTPEQRRSLRPANNGRVFTPASEDKTLPAITLATTDRAKESELHPLSVELDDLVVTSEDLVVKATIIGLLIASAFVDLNYADRFDVTPVYIIVIFLTLWLHRVRWVLGVTATSIVLNLAVLRWHCVHPYSGFQSSTIVSHLLVAAAAQIPAGILAYQSIVSQRRLDRARAEAMSRQRRLYERERAARAAEHEARQREEQATKELRENMADLHRIIASEREARGLRDNLRKIRDLTEQFQRTLLPNVPREIAGCLAVGSLYQPAIQEMQMGGDFYDAMTLPNGMVGLVIGDVAGHGVEAAAQTALVTTTLRAFASENPSSPSEVVARVNRALTLDRQFQGFVSLFYGVYDPATATLRFVNAGHEPPVLLRCNGETDELESTGLVIGVEHSSEYAERELTLHQGDSIVLFTDGITEARQPHSREMFGWGGVAEFAKQYRIIAMQRNSEWITSEAAVDMADSLYHRALAFAGADAENNQGLSDDVALLTVLVRRGNDQEPQPCVPFPRSAVKIAA